MSAQVISQLSLNEEINSLLCMSQKNILPLCEILITVLKLMNSFMKTTGPVWNGPYLITSRLISLEAASSSSSTFSFSRSYSSSSQSNYSAYCGKVRMQPHSVPAQILVKLWLYIIEIIFSSSYMQDLSSLNG